MGKSCAVCGNSIGLMTGKVKLSDGKLVCSKCLKKSGYTLLGPKEISEISNLTLNQVIGKKQSRHKENAGKFYPTQKFGLYAYFDDQNEQLLVNSGNMDINPKTLIRYSDIKDFSANEDGDQIIKSGLGTALAGGFLFGVTGAVVGAIVGKGKKGKKYVEDLSISINLNSGINETVRLIGSKTKVDSMTYKGVRPMFEGIVNKLDNIVKENQNIDTTFSPTDEIKKFKDLLDAEIISQEEFDAKKKELLNL